MTHGHIISSVLIVGGIWKGDILVADIELESLDASEILDRRLNAKGVFDAMKE